MHKYIGDRAFYKKTLAVALPIMVQNGITNFVNMLDNVMVGRLGTDAMSGVSIVNQFLFIFNLMVFGAVAAAGIFTAQYYGSGDTEGVRYTFRIKLLACLLAGSLGVLLFALLGDRFIGLFLRGGEGAGSAALTLAEGESYLRIMLIGLIPYAVTQVYSSTLRETGEGVPPMAASIVAVATNFLLNLVLIFGLLGAPALGVRGAAIATVISRFAELLALALWAHFHKARCPYLTDAYRSLYVPRALLFQVFVQGLPLMANEVFWALAITMRNQCYSVRGLDVVAALNIASTLQNVLSVAYMALGCSIGIIVGRELGAGEEAGARDTARKMTAFTVFAGVVISVLFAGAAFLFPQIYNTAAEVRSLSTYFMLASAAILPFGAYAFAAYYTMRAGGRSFVTVLLDSVFMWVIVIPLCAVLAYFTNVNVYLLFLLGQGTEILKAMFSGFLLKKVNWARRLV